VKSYIRVSEKLGVKLTKEAYWLAVLVFCSAYLACSVSMQNIWFITMAVNILRQALILFLFLGVLS